MNNEIKKIDIARNVFASIDFNKEDRTESPRQEFIRRMGEEANLPTKGAGTYYSMMQMESRGESAYKHHNNKKGSTTVAKKSTVQTGPWKAEKDGETTYHQSRDKARTFSKENGGGWKVSKSN